MKLRAKVITFILFTLIPSLSIGQDFHFSQFYAGPLNLNPAFAGASEETRLGINYRKQWPGLDYNFNGYSAFVDHYSFDLNSGFGLVVNAFNEQHLNLTSSEVGVFYSYNLSISQTLNLRFGNQTSYVRKNGNLSGLLYGDQIDVFNRTILPGSIDNVNQIDPFGYLDLSFGLLLTGDNFWLGGSGYHLNNPKMWYLTDADFEFLPKRFAVHGGVQLDLIPSNYQSGAQESYVTIMGSYKAQGNFDQLDISSQVKYDAYIFGLGFRGIPGNNGLPNSDAMILLLGFSLENGILMGYSYDWVLAQSSRQTRGSHEFSLRYQFFAGNPRDRNQKQKILKCFHYMF